MPSYYRPDLPAAKEGQSNVWFSNGSRDLMDILNGTVLLTALILGHQHKG
ncbi:hypothetical protein [Maridesulfovibrio sp.]